MKIVVCLAFVVLLFLGLAQAYPALEESLDVDSPDALLEPASPVIELNRQKRATCDLLSVFNVNHTACAAHCILMGKKGGHCNGSQVCVCRN